VYNRNTVIQVVWPTLPTSAIEKVPFMIDLKSVFNKYDETANNVLSQWIECADQRVGDHTDVRRIFHEHWQGLDGFDKIIGCQWSAEGKTHPDCGAEIRNYSATCARFNRPPSGRVHLS